LKAIGRDIDTLMPVYCCRLLRLFRPHTPPRYFHITPFADCHTPLRITLMFFIILIHSFHYTPPSLIPITLFRWWAFITLYAFYCYARRFRR